MPYSIGDIEDAIISLLEPLKTSLGVKTIKSYQGELDDEDFRKTVIIVPAIFIVYAGSSYSDYGPRKLDNMTFMLFICDRSFRAEDETRRGGTEGPGTYAMLRGARDSLVEQQVLDGLSPMQIVREEPIFYARGMSVYSAEYTTFDGFLAY